MRRVRYFAVAEDLPDRFLDAELSADALALHVAASAVSSRAMLDGRVPPARLRRVPYWTEERQAALVAAGIWQLDGETAVLPDYLQLNRSREEIEERSETYRKNAEAGWRARLANPPAPPETSHEGPSRPVSVIAQQIAEQLAPRRNGHDDELIGNILPPPTVEQIREAKARAKAKRDAYRRGPEKSGE